MKNFISIFFCFFFFLLTCNAFAVKTTTLATYYPPPTAAYNTVNLSTNYALPTTTNTAANFCSSSNPGAIYLYSTPPPIYYVCTGVGTSSVANGIVHGDTSGTGTLHVIMKNGQDIIYPQECYNAFCSYTSPATACPATPGCPLGFIQQKPIDLNSPADNSDVFQTSANNYVISIVCCSS
jgi:hypothetical protein